ncbi:MAG: extracellular solute-binding protein, partial [Candidatus Bathyarchaeota archaeon]|nr:extracellular solute-binding protein [Candidatus Bathyarchaeota archaeon]
FSLPGATGLVFAADYFFIPAYTQHPDEAKQLFQFLAGADGQEIQVGEGGHIATNLDVALDAYPAVDKGVAEILVGKEVLLDLDDTIGGAFQEEFWTQLKLLWVSPGSLDSVLAALDAKAP